MVCVGVVYQNTNMTRYVERQRATELRKLGKTYGEIKQLLGIEKSTISGWLKDYPLNNEQLTSLDIKIKNRRILGVEKTVVTKLRKREKRLKETYLIEKKKILPLTG